MASKTIINGALGRVGLELLDDDDISSSKARKAYSAYHINRKKVFENHYWNSLLRRAVLAPDSDEPAFQYQSQFTLPADCLRLTEIWGIGGLQYAVEGGKILTNINDKLYISYLYDDVECDYTSGVLNDCLVTLLASDYAEMFKQDSAKQARLRQFYMQDIKDARYVDVVERGDGQLLIDDWTVARRWWRGALSDIDDSSSIGDISLLYSYFG